MKSSDFFSVIATIKKPYSQIPPVFNYCEQIQAFAVKYLFEKKDWLVNYSGRLKHQIMVVCNCSKASRKQLLSIPNIFTPQENNFPEDISFYRNNELWFGTISHERIAFLENATEADIAFLKGAGVKIYC